MIFLKYVSVRFARYPRFSVANSIGASCIIWCSFTLTKSIDLYPSFEIKSSGISKLIFVKGIYIGIDCI